MKGHSLPYPPSPFSLGRVFGWGSFFRMSWGYGFARLRSLLTSVQPTTFEEDCKALFGTALYEILFDPIARKVWGDPRELDAKLSQGRVQTPSIGEILGRWLGLRRSSDLEALTYRYPTNGLQTLWRAIEGKMRPQDRLLLNHAVTGLEVTDGRISRIRCAHSSQSGTTSLAVGADDFVASTLPLGLVSTLMKEAMSPQTLDLVKRIVVLNDLLLVFLHIDRPKLFPELWIFVPDPAIAFHRVSEVTSFDPGMVPDGSIVCCEIMGNETRRMGALTDADLIEMTRHGLAEMGFGGLDVLHERVVRLPRSYPVFRPGYESALRQVLAEHDRISNFRSVGRQGAFNYIGTLDAMDIGYGFARWLTRSDPAQWREERERTSHYDVLD